MKLEMKEHRLACDRGGRLGSKRVDGKGHMRIDAVDQNIDV